MWCIWKYHPGLVRVLFISRYYGGVVAVLLHRMRPAQGEENSEIELACQIYCKWSNLKMIKKLAKNWCTSTIVCSASFLSHLAVESTRTLISIRRLVIYQFLLITLNYFGHSCHAYSILMEVTYKTSSSWQRPVWFKLFKVLHQKFFPKD